MVMAGGGSEAAEAARGGAAAGERGRAGREKRHNKRLSAIWLIVVYVAAARPCTRGAPSLARHRR